MTSRRFPTHRSVPGAILAIALLLSPLAGGCAQSSSWRRSPEARLADDLDAILKRHKGKGATVAARVIDLQTGRELYADAPDNPMIPASNGKLAISAAALDLLGPAHTFKTFLVRDGDDLWIVGSGDPGVGDEKIEASRGRKPTSVFDDWVGAMRRRGITRVKGNVYYWDRAFDDEWVHPNWKRDFLVDWYAAPVSGLNFNGNCIDVTAFGTEPGQPARLEVVPPNSLIRIDNQTVSGGEGGPEPSIERAPDAPSFTLRGRVGEKASFESKPITDPGAFFADAFRTHLANAGIPVEGQTIRADRLPFGPAGPLFDRILAVHETSMIDVLGRVNKNSQNLFAEALSKTTGREWAFRRGESVPGSWSLGEEATRQFLWRNRINAGSFVAVDGSGLARENRVTTRLITDLLVLMHRHPHGRVWRDSLAIGGVDGTIARRMKDMPYVVFAKTGFIGGVRSLSGYVRTEGGRWLAFSFIYNNIEGSVKPFEELQDEACRALHFWPGRPPRVQPTAPAPAEATTAPATVAEPAAVPAATETPTPVPLAPPDQAPKPLPPGTVIDIRG